MITKVTSISNNSNSNNVDYKSTGRPAMTAPKILDKYMDDEGNEVYVLPDNRTQLAMAYNALWNPVRGVINPKGRGENPDSRRRFL